VLRSRPRVLASLVLASCVALVPTAAAASDDDDVSDSGVLVDRWRVHLEADLASWTRQAPWPRDAAQSPGTRDVIGFIGFRRFGFGFGFGRGFRDTIVVGVRGTYEISRGVQRTPFPVDGPRAVEGHLQPYLEFLFVQKHIVRPFAMVRAGIGGATLITPSVGVGLGAHAFVNDVVSIDGLFTVDHRWEYMRLKGGLQGAGDIVATPPASPEELQMRAGHQPFGRRVTVALGIAFSRWF
jgi:hypothetical protein